MVRPRGQDVHPGHFPDRAIQLAPFDPPVAPAGPSKRPRALSPLGRLRPSKRAGYLRSLLCLFHHRLPGHLRPDLVGNERSKPEDPGTLDHLPDMHRRVLPPLESVRRRALRGRRQLLGRHPSSAGGIAQDPSALQHRAQRPRANRSTPGPGLPGCSGCGAAGHRLRVDWVRAARVEAGRLAELAPSRFPGALSGGAHRPASRGVLSEAEVSSPLPHDRLARFLPCAGRSRRRASRLGPASAGSFAPGCGDRSLSDRIHHLDFRSDNLPLRSLQRLFRRPVHQRRLPRGGPLHLVSPVRTGRCDPGVGSLLPSVHLLLSPRQLAPDPRPGNPGRRAGSGIRCCARSEPRRTALSWDLAAAMAGRGGRPKRIRNHDAGNGRRGDSRPCQLLGTPPQTLPDPG